MSFSFGFFDEGVEESTVVMKEVAQAKPLATVKQHPPPNIFDNGGDIVYLPTTYSGFEFKRIVLEESETAIDKTSDIISGVYEGGNKVWECSVDLAVLLFQKKYQLPNPATGRVIELGCGHGFPGIAALQLGYQHVFFSDLNSEVIDAVTWPNVYLNCQSAIPRVSCYSGDWEALSTHLLSNEPSGATISKFDLILTAETLYTEECCHKVLEMVLRHLAPGGVALVASKRFYFGVGGGTYTLQSLVQQDGTLSYDVLEVYEDGLSNIREIIRLQHRNS